MTSLTVVTPWHNAHELAAGYWHAMQALSADDRVIVIDNGSTPPLQLPDDSRFTVVRLGLNSGFSAASNVGLYRAATDAVLFLNNDIRAADGSNWADQIREAVADGRFVGAHLRHEQHAAVDGVPVPYLDGWCLAGSRADLIRIGGWDTGFEEPSYYGDNDLCARAAAAGITLEQIPVSLRHFGNYTSRRYRGRDDVSARNQIRYEDVVRRLRGHSGTAAASIAVITPSLPTRADKLADACASVSAQTLPASVHLVGVDHARKGSVAVRNELVAAAHGCEWVAFLDDDDVLYPNHLELLHGAATRENADIVYSWCDVTGRAGWNPSRHFDPQALRRGNYIPITCLVRRSTLAELGGFRPYDQWPAELQTFDGGTFNGHEDWDLWLRALDAGARFHCVPEPTWRYQLHPGSKTAVGEGAAA